MATASSSGHQFPLHVPYQEWMTCESYLGHTPQESNIRAATSNQNTSTEESLNRAVATLYRRTEDGGGVSNMVTQEVYVSVSPAGLHLSVGYTQNSASFHGITNPQQRKTRVFKTSTIARCSANQNACNRMFVWVCDGEDGDDNVLGGGECHGLLCSTPMEAIRLAHTLANAFHYRETATAPLITTTTQQQYNTAPNIINHKSGALPTPLRRGNALPPLSPGLRRQPLTDISQFATIHGNASPRGAGGGPPARPGSSASVRGSELTRTFAGDVTVALQQTDLPDYESRPNSVARVISPPPMYNASGMTMLD